MTEYETVRKIGSGNQGEVWLVENKNTNQYAAMKIYPKSRELKCAKRELGILRRFGGKGVPYLLDYREDEEYTYLVMEYIDGSPLRELMNKQQVWSEKDCIDIACQIASILFVFHSQSPALIYGDLKPENIVVRQDRSVTLIDFGSVMEIGERKRKVYGTKAYLPSEEDEVSPYRDTYALGVIMYEMLTGQVLSKGIGNRKADIRQLSSGCQRIMKKAVRIRKESGYVDAGNMYEELMACQKALKEEKTMKCRWKNIGNIQKKKNDYILDVKRVVMHGYKKGLCILLIIMTMIGIWKSATQIEAAEQKAQILTQESLTREMLVQEVSVQEVPRDEYGRKMVIRNNDN